MEQMKYGPEPTLAILSMSRKSKISMTLTLITLQDGKMTRHSYPLKLKKKKKKKKKTKMHFGPDWCRVDFVLRNKNENKIDNVYIISIFYILPFDL